MNLKEVTFAVIAGGQGARLGGCVKGLLEVEGQPVISRLLQLSNDFGDRVIIANDPVPYAHFGVRIAADVEPGFGAPGGVVSALLASVTPWVLVCACDMPFVTCAMIDSLRALGGDVACFTRNGRIEPLFALYRQSLGTLWRARLLANPSLRALIQSTRVETEPVSDVRSLESLNTPDDLERHHAVRKF